MNDQEQITEPPKSSAWGRWASRRSNRMFASGLSLLQGVPAGALYLLAVFTFGSEALNPSAGIPILAPEGFFYDLPFQLIGLGAIGLAVGGVGAFVNKAWGWLLILVCSTAHVLGICLVIARNAPVEPLECALPVAVPIVLWVWAILTLGAESYIGWRRHNHRVVPEGSLRKPS